VKDNKKDMLKLEEVTLKDVLKNLSFPMVVRVDAPLSSILEVALKKKYPRFIYVVDLMGRYRGLIQPYQLLWHTFPQGIPSTLLGYELLKYMGSEVAEEVVEPSVKPLSVADTVATATKRLMKLKWNELPVVDEEGKLVAAFNVNHVFFICRRLGGL